MSDEQFYLDTLIVFGWVWFVSGFVVGVAFLSLLNLVLGLVRRKYIKE